MKWKMFIILFLLLISPIFVYAEDYQVKQLIPVDTVATVNTEKFNYRDFKYSSQLDGKGNAKINFGAIQNNTISKTFVSINILLFDENQKNIGIVTYCSDKDVSSDYAGFKLNGNEARGFSINVVSSKYFVKDKYPRDVKYIAVLDDNKYCKVGGYSNYEGLTIDEIVNGGEKKEDNIKLSEYTSFFQDATLVRLILIIGFALIVYIIYGAILNSLHKKIYAKPTILAYVPVANFYIALKLSFGKSVALIGMIIYLIASILISVGISFLSIIVSGISLITFIVVIIKLVTKKYDLFVLEPAIKTNEVIQDNTNINDIIDAGNQQTLDLSYDDADDVALGNINDANVFDISSGEATSEKTSIEEDSLEEDTISTGEVSNNVDEEKKEEGSDLTKFFG